MAGAHQHREDKERVYLLGQLGDGAISSLAASITIVTHSFLMLLLIAALLLRDAGVRRRRIRFMQWSQNMRLTHLWTHLLVSRVADKTVRVKRKI